MPTGFSRYSHRRVPTLAPSAMEQERVKSKRKASIGLINVSIVPTVDRFAIK
jgi:hypothetical protein